MARQIIKKFIAPQAVDGEKILILKDQAIVAQDKDSNVIELLKLDSENKLKSRGQELAFKLDVTAEEVRALSAEQALDGRLTTAEQGLASEVSARQTLESEVDALQSQVNSVLSNTDPTALDSLSEIVTAFQAADSNLNGAITTLASENSQAIAQEVTDRQAADAVLQSAIAAEATARQAAVASESALRASEDQDIRNSISALSTSISSDTGRITAVESSVDALETEVLTLQQTAQDLNAAIQGQTSELSALESELSSLDSRITLVESNLSAAQAEINILKSYAWMPFKKELLQSDIDAGYVDLNHLVVHPECMSASIDRLQIHQGLGDDYTLSTVNGITRITFRNTLMAGGSQALTAGDVLFVKYQYVSV